MTDDLDRLRAELNAATPAPDGDKKAAHLAAARVAFDEAQKNPKDRPMGRVLPLIAPLRGSSEEYRICLQRLPPAPG